MWKKLSIQSSTSAAGWSCAKTAWICHCIASPSAALCIPVAVLLLWVTREGGIWHVCVGGRLPVGHVGMGPNNRFGGGNSEILTSEKLVFLTPILVQNEMKHFMGYHSQPRNSIIFLPKHDDIGAPQAVSREIPVEMGGCQSPSDCLNKLFIPMRIHFVWKFSVSSTKNLACLKPGFLWGCKREKKKKSMCQLSHSSQGILRNLIRTTNSKLS